MPRVFFPFIIENPTTGWILHTIEDLLPVVLKTVQGWTRPL